MLRRPSSALPAALLAAACSAAEPAPTTPPSEAPGLPEPVGAPFATVAELCAEPPVAFEVVDGGRTVARAVRFCAGKTARGTAFVHQLWRDGAPRPDHELWIFLGRKGTFKAAELREDGIPGTPRAPRTVVFRATDRGLERTLHGDRALVAEPDADLGLPWVLSRHAVGIRALALRLGAGQDGDLALQLSYAPETEEILRVPFRIGRTGDTLVADSQAARFVFAAESGPLDWRSVRLHRVEVPGGGVRYRARPVETAESVLPRVPRPTYTLPDDLTVEPVRIEGSGPVLAGEFVRRRDLPGGRTCGAVFLSGSGPQDRHGFVPGTSIDVGSHAITDAIARAGCIVLRFDDRGTGKSERGPADVGYTDEVDDARRAVAVLVRDPRVDPRRIVLVGHSLGGLTAILLSDEPVARGRRPAALVLLSTAGRNLRAVIEDQVRHLHRDDPQKLEAELAKARKVHDAIVADEDVPASVARAAPFLREVFAFDPVAELRKVRAPVLVVQGGKDFQVHPERDFGPLREAVEGPGPPPGRAVRFDGLDHLLKPEPGSSSVGHYGDLSRRVAPEVLDTIVAFLRDEARVLPRG